LASRSRLVNGQRSDGSRESLEPSDVRHSLRRLRRWTCSLLARTALTGCGRCVGGAVIPLRSACWRPCPNRFNPVCPRPGTSEMAVSGLVARKIREASGNTKNGGRCWRSASSSRNRKRLLRIASPRPSRSLAPLTERYAVSRFGVVYRTSSILAHSSATHAARPKVWSRWPRISCRARRWRTSVAAYSRASAERGRRPQSARWSRLLLLMVMPSRSLSRAARPNWVMPVKRAAMLESNKLRIRNP